MLLCSANYTQNHFVSCFGWCQPSLFCHINYLLHAFVNNIYCRGSSGNINEYIFLMPYKLKESVPSFSNWGQPEEMIGETVGFSIYLWYHSISRDAFHHRAEGLWHELIYANGCQGEKTGIWDSVLDCRFLSTIYFIATLYAKYKYLFLSNIILSKWIFTCTTVLFFALVY